MRAPRGHPRADAQVGQEEAQAAELRGRRQPRGGPRRRRGARRRLRRARALRDRGARGARGRARARRRGPRRARTRRGRAGRAPRPRARPRIPLDRARALRARSCARRTSRGCWPPRSSRACRSASTRWPSCSSCASATGSYAQAGIVAAAFALGGGAGAPVSGRLVDRFGHRRVLAAARARPRGGARRARRPGPGRRSARRPDRHGGRRRRCHPAHLRGPAPAVARAAAGRSRPDPGGLALDSVLIELVFVVGPLLTALATACCRPWPHSCWRCVMVIAGTVAFAAAEPSRAWRPAPREPDRSRLGALRLPRRADAGRRDDPDRLLLRGDGGDAARLQRGRRLAGVGGRPDRGVVAGKRRGRPVVRARASARADLAHCSCAWRRSCRSATCRSPRRHRSP